MLFSQEIFYNFFFRDWEKLIKFVSIVSAAKQIVKFADSGKINDEDIDYWNEKLLEYKSHIDSRFKNEQRLRDGYGGRDELDGYFLIKPLLIDMKTVLDKFNKRKLELAKLEELNKNIEENTTHDINQEVMTTTDIQQNDSNDPGLCQFCVESKLPEFHGENFEEWLKFSNAFIELVHNNTQMPISTKLNYLREKIKDKPRTLIAYLISGTDSNYKLAWETLEKRYNNKRILFTSKLDCLLDMEIMKSDNYRSLQKMHDTAKKCIYLMKKHLNRDIGESADEIFAHIIIRKMDAAGRAQYEQYGRKPKSIQKLQDVMEFLEQRSEILENLENCEDAEPKQPNTNILETIE